MKVWRGKEGKRKKEKGWSWKFVSLLGFPFLLLEDSSVLPPSPSIATCKLYRLAKSAANPSSPKAKIKTRILRQVSSFFLLFSLLPFPSIHCPPSSSSFFLGPRVMPLHPSATKIFFFFSPSPLLGFAAPKTGGEWREKRERDS